MIDAYEIGIQLLLQEDVSAGLAVINLGLADVDRAIAATSAHLVGLGQEAERVAKAVSAAVGGKLPQVVAADAKSVSPTTDLPASSEKEISPLGAATAGPVAKGGSESSAPPANTTQIDDRQAPQPVSMPTIVERREEATAPTKTVVSEIAASGRQDAAASDDWNNRPAADRAISTSPYPEPSERQTGRDVPAVEVRPTQGSSAPNAGLVLTAAVKPSGGPGRAPSVRSNQVRAQLSDRFPSGQDRAAAAPRSSVDRITQQSLSARPMERAAAPQSPGRDRSESGGGTVMLDGRLVGQWLSEHMGREASRPPGGTSFFDARQTPAWNVSGAL